MSGFHNNALIGASGQGGYQINQSLRFNSADSAYLNRTPASAGNRKTWTWSGWVKRSSLANHALFSAGTTDSTRTLLYFDASNGQLYFFNNASGTITGIFTSAYYRDVSAWYHVVLSVDTTQATASNRGKIYINGIEQTVSNYVGAISQNSDLYVNATNAHGIGAQAFGTAVYSNGYLAEVNFIDGTALTPSSFGETDAITGAWIPKRYSGSYGTNGFYLKYESSGIGTDSSGNGNTWTANNFSTSGTGTDVMSDTPTNNWCTLNPLDQITGRSDLTNGNLDISTGSTTNGQARSTLALPSSGKHYFEATVTSGTSASAQINVGLLGQTSTNTGSFVSGMYSLTFDTGRRTVINGTLSSRAGTAASTNDVIQVAVDMSTGNGWVGQNNTWYDSSNGTTGNPATGANPTFTGLSSLILCGFGWTYNNGLVFNFGQRAFAYTPPTGFKALNTANLPEPTIKKGGAHFNTVLWTGANSSSGRSITGVGFSPDFVWAKRRDTAGGHLLYDTIRGAGSNKELTSNGTDAEGGTNAESFDYLSSFDVDGFSSTWSGVNSAYYFNTLNATYVAWNWKANGAGSSNTAGSITSTVSANATAGFSIVTYTGTGSNATVGHGLGVAPSMMIIKRRNAAGDWGVYHTSLGDTKYVYLQDTQAVTTSSTIWNNTSPTSSVFSVGTSGVVNANTGTYVAYCFSEVASFSKFGSYVGNGSSDGLFVACNFRPRWLLIKRTDSANDWVMKDAARNSYNTTNLDLYANTSQAEVTFNEIDFTSNGFKIRNSNASTNASGGTYVFAAFSETAFKFANAR